MKEKISILEKEIDNVNFILSSSEGDDFDVAYTKYLISDRKKTKAIAIRPRVRGKIVNNKPIYKNPYFYIFDFSDEEIARNLTLISYKMISYIDINELWSSNFIKEDKYTKAPNKPKIAPLAPIDITDPFKAADNILPLIPLRKYIKINFHFPKKSSTLGPTIYKEYILSNKWIIPPCKNIQVTNRCISPLLTRGP